LSDFAGAELLEVLQGQHFAIHRIHTVERFLNVNALLGLDGGLRGGRQFAEQLRRQRGGVGLGESPPMQRHFAVGVAQLRTEMTTMDLR
jgi:hypothetical protein